MSYPAKILLIKLVKQHESIWNTRSQNYARSDLKTQAWNEIAEKMHANGFESKVGRLKVMWKNLRDQWKRNLALKMPPEREWYFQRRINFLAGTYEDGELAHCPHSLDASPEIHDEAPDDSLYDVKAEAFDYLESGYAVGGGTLMNDDSNGGAKREPKSEMDGGARREPKPEVTDGGARREPKPEVTDGGAKREPKSEMTDDGAAYGQTLVTVLPGNGTARTSKKQSNSANVAVASSSVQGSSTNPAPPPAKRTRMETRSGATSVVRQRENGDKNGSSTKPPKGAANGQMEMPNEKEHADKYDKYAAFVSSTLREMPEMEAKRRMREMTMLLLEDIDFNV
ncbi:hypothetical protein KIN20_021676 [Parelaphostrongylus tenuis]|uniref:MADF domain-containing protein n=1 Tax=Parelaphostrongylus tenuis TaxID=148309 RepID=A0AAD5MPM0_PARTN|nr:hypothetical protein KIN20_021676 [Parelaphostrongylus tenuis]